MNYEQLPGPTRTAVSIIDAPAAKVCAAISPAVAQASLQLESLQNTANGCQAMVKRSSPWWLPGDDGERLKIEINQTAIGRTDIKVYSRRNAPGQIWVATNEANLLASISDKARE